MHIILTLEAAVRKLDFCCQANDGKATVTRDDVMPQDLRKTVYLIEHRRANEAPYLESVSISRVEAIDKACENRFTYSSKRAPNGFREELTRENYTDAVYKGNPPATTRLIPTTFEQMLAWPSATWNNPPPPDEFLI